MKAYVITIEGHPYSEACADRCIRSANVPVETFKAVSAQNAAEVAEFHGLKWTWRDSGSCPATGLNFHKYGGGTAARLGCALSHYLLWLKCAESEPLLILEHDAVFLRPLPCVPFIWICQVNDPRGATPRGAWWSDQMAARGAGLFPKTHVLEHPRPDGLAGNSAYLIQPAAAQHMVDLAHRVGLWPNDALMCRQLVPNLQELYPFVTRVQQDQSTTCA